jgi:hypothetical protein
VPPSSAHARLLSDAAPKLLAVLSAALFVALGLALVVSFKERTGTGLVVGLTVAGLLTLGLGVLAADRLATRANLERHGRPDKVASAILAELDGQPYLEMTVRMLYPGKWLVALTPSWLLLGHHCWLNGTRAVIVREAVRLNEIVRARRDRLREVGNRAAAIFVDRHGYELEVPGPEGAVRRLLAEVFARAPGILTAPAPPERGPAPPQETVCRGRDAFAEPHGEG